ncbi:helix-turn-helix domain-containing protein [Photobacterium kishitanii]|uniref:helix-turn-helix domain-containing protein n=1 Tax=Photobacterium kishitanii TaxID=318456 RepID=UPI000D15FEC7|nr:helix-turn-helix transcriptional regulator [Photobacterium kishitanii]PSU20082.1 hypothetical protein CTM84_13920 [Photobacterium kishitanii]
MTCLIIWITLTRLYNETATRVDLEVIEQLCDYLDIPAGDYLKYKRIQWISLYNS